jgi:hypothetical protein
MQEAQEQQTSSPADASSEAPETVTEELQQSEQQEAADKPEEGDEGDDQGGEEKPQEKPKRSARERINELTKRAHEAEREARMAKPAERKPAESAGKPSPDKFGSYDEYVEALAEWKTDQRVSESFKRRDAERSQAAQDRAADAREQAWQARQIEFRKSNPDYDSAFSSLAGKLPNHVVETIGDSDFGPHVVYHLAKHPETVKRINALPPLAAARELGRIEATLSNPAAPQFKPASKAPAPITPARSSAPAAVDLASANMDQYIAARRKQGATFRRR